MPQTKYLIHSDAATHYEPDSKGGGLYGIF